MRSSTLRILLIEDNAPFRKAMERALGAISGVTRVAGYGSCEEALVAIGREVEPDIILLDVGLPGMDGIEGVRYLKEAAPGAQVVVLTVFEDDDKIFRAVCAGASGYLLKTASVAEIARAVNDILEGGSPMSPRVARRVLAMFARPVSAQPSCDLAPRERELLELLVKGYTNKEIAGALTLSVHTVDSYMRRIYEKLHVNTRAAAVGRALRDRLV